MMHSFAVHFDLQSQSASNLNLDNSLITENIQIKLDSGSGRLTGVECHFQGEVAIKAKRISELNLNRAKLDDGFTPAKL